MGFANAVGLYSPLRRSVMCFLLLVLPGLPATAQVAISSPAAGSTSISAVTISASANEGSTFSHMEVWDNGDKLGDVFATSVNAVYVLPNGPHTMTVFAVTSGGTVLGQTDVSYTVAENCTTSTSVQCNMEQQAIDNQQNNCAPPQETSWVANPCGSGIQGSGGTDPASTNITAATESGTIADQEETTLNGQSLHLSEVQGSGGYSNVIFKVDTPQKTPTSPVQPNWTLDEYAYLPNPLAHQAFEIDAQYVISGIWTKFYSQCAFNISNGTGYWSVFDVNTGGWLYLEGQTLSNGTKVPSIPCNRSQWSQPWAYSGSGHSTNPTFSGWHHIVWQFQRNSDGSVTYVSLTFDGTTYPLNLNPPSGTGGSASNNGDFSPAVQLDGAKNTSGDYDTVDAYVNELNITHTQ